MAKTGILLLLLASVMGTILLAGCFGTRSVYIDTNNTAIPPSDLSITPLPFETCIVNEPCSVQVVSASGGTEPRTFLSDSFATGAPPMGMIVEMGGNLVGTPTREGIYNFGVCVHDAIGISKCGMTAVTVQPRIEAPNNGADNGQAGGAGAGGAAGNGQQGTPSYGGGGPDTTDAGAGTSGSGGTGGTGSGGTGSGIIEYQKVPESWEIKLTGTYPDPDTQYCDGAQYRGDYTVQVTFPSSFMDDRNRTHPISWQETNGTFSGTESVINQGQYCDVNPTTVSNIAVEFGSLMNTEAGDIGSEIGISAKNNAKLIVATRTDHTYAYGDLTSDSTIISGIVLKVKSIDSPARVSGKWDSIPYSAAGEFTMTKKG